jgi:hypothetical protein
MSQIEKGILYIELNLIQMYFVLLSTQSLATQSLEQSVGHAQVTQALKPRTGQRQSSG